MLTNKTKCKCILLFLRKKSTQQGIMWLGYYLSGSHQVFCTANFLSIVYLIAPFPDPIHRRPKAFYLQVSLSDQVPAVGQLARLSHAMDGLRDNIRV